MVCAAGGAAVSNKTLRLKLFRAFGANEEQNIQREVNAWLASADDQGNKIEKMETTMCSIGCDTDIYQHLVISIWYTTTGRNPRA